MYNNVAFQHVASLRNISRCTASSLCSWIRSCATVLEPMSPSRAFLRAIRTFRSCRELMTWLTWYVDDPPAFRMYTPPPCSYISIKCLKGTGGRWSSPATERGAKKVYTFLFWIEWDMGWTCLAPAQNNIWETPRMYSSGGWAATMNYQFIARVKILKCMKHRGGHVHVLQ